MAAIITETARKTIHGIEILFEEIASGDFVTHRATAGEGQLIFAKGVSASAVNRKVRAIAKRISEKNGAVLPIGATFRHGGHDCEVTGYKVYSNGRVAYRTVRDGGVWSVVGAHKVAA